MKYLILVIALLSVLFIGCSDNKSTSTGPTDVNTETWQSIANDTLGTGTWYIKQSTGGTLNISGNWVFEWDGIEASCVFTSGTAIVTGDSLNFTGSGNAHYAGAPVGYQDSPFVLKSRGIASSGNFSGVYEITFTTFGWPSKFSGTTKSKRIAGSGITK